MKFSIQEIKDFLDKNEDKYNRLYEDIVYFFQVLKSDLSDNNISRIYTRKDLRTSSNGFKDYEKIQHKLNLWAKNKNDVKISDLHDIIAATIVVYYEIDIKIIFEKIINNCIAFGLIVERYLSGEYIKKYTSYGYHAQHFVFTSTNPMLKGFKCEVQIKTVLHEAWQIKTHDLIYKPKGLLDIKHRQIMESFGDIIQAIEIQSQTVRKLITQEWEYSDYLRYLSRTQIIEWLHNERKNTVFDEKLVTEYESVLKDIINDREIIRVCHITDPKILLHIKNIEDLAKKDDGLNAAWPLMVYLASIREDNHLNYTAKQYLDDWLKGNSDEALCCFYKSFVHYVINERHEAIISIKKFLNASHIKNAVIRRLQFNLLYYLIEEASCSWQRVQELKNQCDEIIKLLDGDEWRDLPIDAIQDTKGYYLIIFGSTKEEIKTGVRICQNTHSTDPTTLKFLEIHEDIGWSRYVSIERDLF